MNAIPNGTRVRCWMGEGTIQDSCAGPDYAEYLVEISKPSEMAREAMPFPYGNHVMGHEQVEVVDDISDPQKPAE